MKLKNVLIVVKDIERARQFYQDLFGLSVVLDNDGNMILTEGLVLQAAKIWKELLGREILQENNSCELYFEEADIEGFVERLERIYPEVRYVNRLMTHSWGQGFGMQLMERWERDMKSDGYGMVMTSTQVDEQAQHFYRRLGYKDTGGFVVNTPGYEQPMELIMVKSI